MGPDNQNNLQNNSFGSNMPVMGPQPTPAPQQPVMGVPQPLPDVQPQSVEPQPMAQPQPVEPQPVEPQPMGPQPLEPQPLQPQPLEPQPIGQPQPIQPEPVQPESMLGTQPGMQPLPGAQPVPEQPGMPGSQPMSAPKSKKNLIIIAAIAGVAVIAIVIAIIVILNSGKKPSEPANPFPEPEANIVVPTPELAKSVCEKYNGTLVISEGEEVADDYKEVESRYVCQRYENAQQEGDIQTIASYTANDFMYQVDFVKEDKIDEHWTRMKSAITKSEYEILENSDDVIIAHDSMTGAGGVNVETDMVIYEEATVALATYTKDNPLAEEILKELGFVEDDDNGGEEGGEGGENGGGSGNGNGGGSSTANTGLTIELAESVCKKHGGEFGNYGDLIDFEATDIYEGMVSSIVGCEKTDDFMYEIYFLNNDKLEEFRSRIKDMGVLDDDLLKDYLTLKYPDEYITEYSYIDDEDSSVTVQAADLNTVLTMTATSKDAAGDILAELGFSGRRERTD